MRITILAIITCILCVISFIIYNKMHDQYVTSTYSKYCYKTGYENKNMRYKTYYETLEDCNKPLNINYDYSF
jgi:hypothetical protein